MTDEQKITTLIIADANSAECLLGIIASKEMGGVQKLTLLVLCQYIEIA